MKTIKRNLTLSITIALVSVLSVSIAATAIRSNRNTHTKFYPRPATEKAETIQAGVVKYDGEFIQLVQLPEVVITDTAIEKKK